MDIASIVGAGAPNQAAKTEDKSIGADKDQFLQLLLAQLKHQDPMQAPDATAMAEQITQYGQLEQLMNLNSSILALAGSQSTSDRSQAVSYIGKNVSVYGDKFEIGEEDKGSYGFQVPQYAKEVDIVIRDADNKNVRTIKHQDLEAGNHVFSFDGKDASGNDLANGAYSIQVTAFNAEEEQMAAQALTGGTVSGIEFSQLGPVIQVGQQKFSLEDVVLVKS